MPKPLNMTPCSQGLIAIVDTPHYDAGLTRVAIASTIRTHGTTLGKPGEKLA